VIKLLKRTWFSARPNERHLIASLYGRESLETLAKVAKPSVELAVIKTDLDEILYSAEGAKLTLRRDLLFKFAEHWIKHHKRSQKQKQKLKQHKNASANTGLTQGGKHATV